MKKYSKRVLVTLAIPFIVAISIPLLWWEVWGKGEYDNTSGWW